MHLNKVLLPSLLLAPLGEGSQASPENLGAASSPRQLQGKGKEAATAHSSSSLQRCHPSMRVHTPTHLCMFPQACQYSHLVHMSARAHYIHCTLTSVHWTCRHTHTSLLICVDTHRHKQTRGLQDTKCLMQVSRCQQQWHPGARGMGRPTSFLEASAGRAHVLPRH